MRVGGEQFGVGAVRMLAMAGEQVERLRQLLDAVTGHVGSIARWRTRARVSRSGIAVVRDGSSPGGRVTVEGEAADAVAVARRHQHRQHLLRLPRFLAPQLRVAARHQQLLELRA